MNVQPGNQHAQTETIEPSAQMTYNGHKTANKTDDQQFKGRQHASVAILGDSMLKYVSSAHLRKNTKANVQVKTFPGGRVDDMKFYVKPTLARAPDCVILHMETHFT